MAGRLGTDSNRSLASVFRSEEPPRQDPVFRKQEEEMGSSWTPLFVEVHAPALQTHAKVCLRVRACDVDLVHGEVEKCISDLRNRMKEHVVEQGRMDRQGEVEKEMSIFKGKVVQSFKHWESMVQDWKEAATARVDQLAQQLETARARAEADGGDKFPVQPEDAHAPLWYQKMKKQTLESKSASSSPDFRSIAATSPVMKSRARTVSPTAEPQSLLSPSPSRPRRRSAGSSKASTKSNGIGNHLPELSSNNFPRRQSASFSEASAASSGIGNHLPEFPSNIFPSQASATSSGVGVPNIVSNMVSKMSTVGRRIMRRGEGKISDLGCSDMARSASERGSGAPTTERVFRRASLGTTPTDRHEPCRSRYAVAGTAPAQGPRRSNAPTPRTYGEETVGSVFPRWSSNKHMCNGEASEAEDDDSIEEATTDQDWKRDCTQTQMDLADFLSGGDRKRASSLRAPDPVCMVSGG